MGGFRRPILIIPVQRDFYGRCRFVATILGSNLDCAVPAATPVTTPVSLSTVANSYFWIPK